ncbi:MAG TPA: hypothetical protein VFM97_09605 [Gammaproteobacteria bacterium]|nr:hypothetical protein [Gammaproteobacteria bacterium]
MKIIRRLIAGLVVGILGAGLLVACHGSSEAADPGVSMAQVNAAIADAVNPLKQQISDQAATIATLQNTVKANASAVAVAQKLANLRLTIQAPNASKVSTQSLSTQSYGDSHDGMQTASTEPQICLGTLTAHPNNSDPRATNQLAGISCSGYNYQISAATAAENAVIAGLPNEQQLLFTGAGCTGDVYLNWASVADQVGGEVFAAAIFSDGRADWLTDPNAYKMLKAGTQPTSITYLSHSDGTNCYDSPAANTQQEAYAVVANDVAITNLPSAPIPGPVLGGTVQ